MLSTSDFEFIIVCTLNQFIFSFFIISFIPILFIRWFITKLRILCSSDIKKMLNGISCTYTVEDIEKSTGNNVIFCLKIQGKLDVQKTLDRISKLIYKNNKNGKLVYPEFQMYWIKWFGYPVWKLEKYFSINNHVIHAVIPYNYNKDKFISNFEQDMLRKPFKTKQSPWEIALVDGIEQPQSWYWLFKFHHSLADGHSIFKALMTCCDNYVPLYESKQPQNTVLKFVTYPFIGMYEWIKLSLDSTHPNPWKIPVDKMSLNSRVIIKSRWIHCAKINKISSLKQVSFTAVLMSAVTGGIHNTIKRQGKTMPNYIVTRMPIPAPIKHNESLMNNFTAVFMKLPTGVTDSGLRIKLCENEILTVKKSTCSLTSFLITNLLGSLPSCLQKIFPPSFQAIQISNFPGPKELIIIGNQPVIDMHFIVWCTKRNPVYLSILSYNGRIRFTANVDPNIFPTEILLKDFVKEIENQLEIQ